MKKCHYCYHRIKSNVRNAWWDVEAYDRLCRLKLKIEVVYRDRNTGMAYICKTNITCYSTFLPNFNPLYCILSV